MPVEYKVYGCKHHCGWKHHESKAKIEKHEAECWLNLDNKTCATCAYGVIRRETIDGQRVRYRDCMLDGDRFDGLTTIPKVNCSDWSVEFELF